MDLFLNITTIYHVMTTRNKEELGYQLSIEYEPRSGEPKNRKEDVNTIISKTKSNLKEIFTFTNATPFRNVVGTNFVCHLCPIEFTDSGELKKHTLEEHIRHSDAEQFDEVINEIFNGKFIPTIKLDITSLTCKCDATINSLEDLFQHLIEEHKRVINTGIKNILIPFKFETEQWRCCVCVREFGTFKTLLEHMNSHISNYMCELCNSTFITQERLKIHMKFSHELGTFKCNFCPKVFSTKLKVYYHERGVHTKKNKIKNCEHCDEQFETLWERQKHQFKEHGIAVPKLTKVKCNVCDREFSDQSANNLHFRRCHLLEKNHKCQYCDMRFFDTSSLRKHVYKHTGEKNFHCQVCSKSFSLKNTLTEHMRIHDNDRRYKCEHCGQTFVQRCSWRGHMRTKHGHHI
ncbi:unnamed protein product [Pieris macdunnoughi]|uniref:C2H2-type domain-containing protein n=1 Tax=Pieris macdunnoughi TaxID=345717 RepID=A0A821UET3_9NEOP|nr:unnamed protein product [Pieris macdunnoughi]